jgi:hypothetical protein
VDVYLDAVLHPKCVNDKRTFEQVRAALQQGVKCICATILARFQPVSQNAGLCAWSTSRQPCNPAM